MKAFPEELWRMQEVIVGLDGKMRGGTVKVAYPHRTSKTLCNVDLHWKCKANVIEDMNQSQRHCHGGELWLLL